MSLRKLFVCACVGFLPPCSWFFFSDMRTGKKKMERHATQQQKRTTFFYIIPYMGNRLLCSAHSFAVCLFMCNANLASLLHTSCCCSSSSSSGEEGSWALQFPPLPPSNTRRKVENGPLESILLFLPSGRFFFFLLQLASGNEEERLLCFSHICVCTFFFSLSLSLSPPHVRTSITPPPLGKRGKHLPSSSITGETSRSTKKHRPLPKREEEEGEKKTVCPPLPD